MKNKKCPKRKFCFSYKDNDCDGCDVGEEILKLHKRIDRLKKQNETLTIQRNAWALTAKAMGNMWISVDDRLPDKYGAVLVACEGLTIGGYAPIAIGSYGGGFWSIADADGTMHLTKYMRCIVTHWMPLPEPPKMKGGERE